MRRRHGSGRLALGALIALLTVPLALGARVAPSGAGEGDSAGPAAGFVTILEPDLRADLEALAGAALEGRDTPSAGLTRAAGHVAARLEAAGLTGAGAGGSFLLPFAIERPMPHEAECRLAIDAGPDGPHDFNFGADFVPLWLAHGKATGEAVFYGYGLESPSDKYYEIRGETKGKIAVIVEGEPRHKRIFDGPEVSPAADVYAKLAALAEAEVAGVLVVRRPPGASGDGAEDAAPLGFRHTWASWVTDPPQGARPPPRLPALEITAAAAQALLGIDPIAAVTKSDKSGKAQRPVKSGRTVSLAAMSSVTSVTADNVVGILRGRDQALAEEFVVIGAHYDHVGVDTRGRIGHGADDNASGTAAMLEVVEALAAAGTRRSILACAFAGEEDGLLGSAALCQALPVPREKIVAMINLDMVGRGDAGEVAVLGIVENPSLEKLLGRAQKLHATRIRRLVLREGQDLFARSDHYNFHQIGVPTLFFFEGLPIERNADYHTWRDTIDLVDLDKVARTARLVFNTTWLLAEEDERPPPPERPAKR